MVTSAVFIASIGTLLLKCATSAAINYEPIKITVNENFNSQPAQIFQGPKSLEPGVIHQGANFYYKPQLNLPSYVPPRIEDLISLIQQYHHSCTKDTSELDDKNKLMEILKPFMYRTSDIPEENPLRIVLKNGNNLENTKPLDIVSGLKENSTKSQAVPIKITEEPKPVTPELLIIPEASMLRPLSHNGIPVVLKEVNEEESGILKEPTGVFPNILKTSERLNSEPILNNVEPKPVSSELEIFPDTRSSLNDIHEVRGENPILDPVMIEVESKPVTPELRVIPEAPVLPPRSLNNVSSITEDYSYVKREKPILEEPTSVFPTISEISVRPMQEPITNFVKPKSITLELGAIPEARALSPLSFNNIPSTVEEDVKKEESLILEEPTSVQGENPILEPVISEVESKPVTPELAVIPEAPVLPPLSLSSIPSNVEEDARKEESIVLEEPTSVFPTISEISARPVQEPINSYIEPKPVTPEVGAIPEAPVLPPLSLSSIPYIVEEDVKKEKSIVLESPTSVSPTISEISARPIQDPINSYVEPKPVTPELGAIPDAPVLPPLSLNSIPSIVEDAKKEESIILKEPSSVLSTITEISASPIQKPIINYVQSKPVTTELGAIPEAPILPPLSLSKIPSVVEDVKKEESIILKKPTSVFPILSELSASPIQEPITNYVEPKPITPELEAIPEAPVLPPLSLSSIPSVVEENGKKEESIILESPTSVFPTISEISARPIQEPINSYVEPKPVTPELGSIPEAPVLPPLSLSSISSILEEDAKKEESIILDEPTSVFPTISEISARPIQEPIINYVQSKPVTPELGAIPEAPILPPLSLSKIPSVVEDVKKEESIILEEPTSVFPTNSELSARPIQEPITNYVQSKPVTPELGAIPEAPILPPLSLSKIPSVVEDVKKEESIILEEPTSVFPTNSELSARPIQEPITNYVEPKPKTPEVGAIPEAPILPPLSLTNIPSVVEEDAKKEESVVLEEPTSVFPTILEISAKPIQEPINSYVEPKPITPEVGAIPEAPILPPLSLTNIPSIVEEDAKKEESVILEEPTSVFPTISEISAKPIQEPNNSYVEPKPVTFEVGAIPEAPVLPPLSLTNIPSIVEEDVKKEESLILESSTSVFPTISEISARPVQEPIINYVQSESVTPEIGAIPEAPVLPSLSINNVASVLEEDVKKQESRILEESTNVFSKIPEISVSPMQEPIINYVELKPKISELGVIPEGPVLPHFSLNDIHVTKNEVNIEEPITLEDYTDVFPKISEITIRPISKSSMFKIGSKPATSGLVVISKAPVLPPQPYIGNPPIFEKGKIEKSFKGKKSTGVYSTIPKISAILKPSVVYKTAESFPVENKVFPKEGKVEVLLGESVEDFFPNTEMSSGLTFQEPEITNSYMMEEISRPNPFTESVVTIRETLPSAIIPKTSGVFSYVPFVSHFSNRAPYSKQLMSPKPASLQSFLVMKRPFHPEMPYPKVSPSITEYEYNKHFILPRYYAHDIVEKRITPNMPFKNNAPKRVKIVIRPNDSRGPSQL